MGLKQIDLWGGSSLHWNQLGLRKHLPPKIHAWKTTFRLLVSGVMTTGSISPRTRRNSNKLSQKTALYSTQSPYQTHCPRGCRDWAYIPFWLRGGLYLSGFTTNFAFQMCDWRIKQREQMRSIEVYDRKTFTADLSTSVLTFDGE